LAREVFFPPRQSAFDASPVHAQPPLFPQLLCKSGSTEIGIFRLLFLKELHDLLTQLACSPGTTLLRPILAEITMLTGITNADVET
jgi:hypothetical protein